MHDFVVVESLVTPVILGVDFLHKNALVLDFAETPAVIHPARVYPPLPAEERLARDQVHSLYEDTHKTGRGGYTSAVIEQPGTDVIDEYAVPMFLGPGSIELPECPRPGLMSVVQELIQRPVPNYTRCYRGSLSLYSNHWKSR